MNENIIIAIDGPAGSGKSTTAKLLADKLGFIYLDTGAMYRSVALAAVKRNIDLKDEEAVNQVARSIEIDIVLSDNGYSVLLDGVDVSLEIREPAMDYGSSLVSSYKLVREAMVEIQQNFAGKGNIVAEGRDMGTVVFPNASVKIFLVADLETRAVRRTKQLEEAGLKTSIEDQTSSLESRDASDSNREHSPLKKANDAIEVDTTNLTLDGQVEKIYQLVMDKIGER
jgi:cytidylate kinase